MRGLVVLRSLLWASGVLGHRFVVQLEGNTSVSTVIEEYSLNVKAGGIETVVVGEKFRALVGTFSAETLGRLNRDTRIGAISIDRDLQLQEYVIQGQAPQHLSRLASSSTAVHRPFMFDSRSGKGVDMYLFDSGIDFKHPGLGNVGVARLEDLTGSPVPKGCDPHGHGTAMAGLIASETFGVLKRCDLVDVRIADERGRVRVSQLLKGLAAAVGHASRSNTSSVFVVPMLVEPKNYVLASALGSISDAIAIVLPAGNQNSDACDFTFLDNRGSDNVLVVGAVDDRNRVASFSNHGDCVDVYASGVDVTTLQSTDVYSEALIRSVNGTSAGCAIGAGVVGYYMSMGLKSREAIAKIREISREVSRFPYYCRLLQLEP